MSEQSNSTALTLRESLELGKVFYDSGLFADLKSAAQAVVKIQAGAELGVPPFASITGINVIEGKPSPSAGLIAGLIKASHKYNYKVLRLDDTGCILEFSQDGQTIGTSAFTYEDAKKISYRDKDAGYKPLVEKYNWRQYPRNMYFARAISNGARWYCPDVFHGSVYTAEELGHDDVVEAEYHEVAPEPKVTLPYNRQNATEFDEPVKPVRAISADGTVDVYAIREQMQADAQHTASSSDWAMSDAQRNLLIALLSEATGHKGPDADQDRHLVLEFLFGKPSSKTLSYGEMKALFGQLIDADKSDKDTKTYILSDAGKRVVNAVIVEAMRVKGQKELAL
jgi:hypothetical protein